MWFRAPGRLSKTEASAWSRLSSRNAGLEGAKAASRYSGPAKTSSSINTRYATVPGDTAQSGTVFTATLNGRSVIAVRQPREATLIRHDDGTEDLQIHDASLGGDNSVMLQGVPVSQ
ncbi:hypothetical protein IAT40_004513 [Kwoniella sp. CBS 6097]